MSGATTAVLAVGLAALGALLFGLAAVRQHGAVRAVVGGPAATRPAGLGSVLRLVRSPRWLLGAGQAGLGGALHMTALTLAPITLVQPVGVLAVPVAVVRSALVQRRRPTRTQVLGTVLSTTGVLALTVVLLRAATRAAVLPPWSTAATTVAVVVLGALALVLLLGRVPAAVRGVGRSVVAAVLFGLGSALVRVLGQVVTTAPRHPSELVLAAALGLALALPLGVWSMQSAYVVSAPQVVVCCLTLLDPVAAIVVGRVLLGDGAAVGGTALLAALACGLCAAAGVVLLARHYPVEDRPAVVAS